MVQNIPFYSKKFKTFNLFFAFLFFSSQVFSFSPASSADGQTSAQKSRQYIETMKNVFNLLEASYVEEFDTRKLYEGALKGMLEALEDPYTVYMDMPQLRNIQNTTIGHFGGVGLTITKPFTSTPEKPSYVEVVSPIEDSPGWKAGIQAGDFIVSIDETETQGITMEEVLSLLRGRVGDPVNLMIKRGKNMEFPVTLLRDVIEVPTVKHAMIENDIGYLRIAEFTPKTPERAQEALDFFSKQNYKGLIIDLRNNPGGLITSVVSVADKFIDAGVIVSTKGRSSKNSSHYNANNATTTVKKGLPIVVLINKGSASASEILAGALKDYHLAYLVGENTFGKGSVQQVIPLPNTDGIKMTMARYYTPSDANIDKVGIPPDRESKLPDLTEEEEKAYQNLVSSQEISTKVASNPTMSSADVARYAGELQKTYKLDLRILRRLINIEVFRTKEQPVYDLDFDIQLKEAVSVLRNESVAELIRKTKTIHELQDEAAKKAEKEK
ncbi:MAG: S41 family peptidase [Treponemataceae bacterium]